MAEVNVLPKVGKNNGVATYLQIVKKFSQHQVVNWRGTGDGIMNTQACGHPIKTIDVYTAHSYYADEEAKTKFGMRANKQIILNARRAKRIICVSNYVMKFLKLNGISKNNMVVIPNPLDIQEIDDVKADYKGLPKTFTLFMGNRSVKRPDLFLELAKQFPNDKFVWIDAPLYTKLPKNIKALPPLERSTVLKIIKRCKVFLLLSKRESCPYALLEAMAMGKTCIASNFAGQSEMVKNGKNGYLFTPDNIFNLAKTYKLAKEKPLNSRGYVEQYHDARVQVPKIDSVYTPPKVSIITYVRCTPENKRWPLLLDAIKSVQLQNFNNYEHLIIDDGSTINLKKKILDLNDPHMKYYYKPNSGILKTTTTFNLGLRKCQGAFVMILPSDDLHMPNTMNRLATYLKRHPQVIAVTGNYIDQRYMGNKLRKEHKVIRHEPSIKNRLLHDNCVNAVACMFRRSVLNQIELPPNDTGFAADYDLWVRISEKGGFDRIPDCVIKYRCFSDATRHKTQKDMKYRQRCVDKVLFRAKKRRNIR